MKNVLKTIIFNSFHVRLYWNLVHKRKTSPLEKSSGTHTHHIIPLSEGGADVKDNKVELTIREHFVAHRLLKHIYADQNMVQALFIMSKICIDHGVRISSRMVEKLKMEYVESISGENHWWYGKKGSTWRRDLDEKMDYILEQHQNGKSTTDLANELGCSPGAIQNRIKSKLGVVENHRYRRDIWEDKQVIVERRRNGESCKKIAEDYGCDASTIQKLTRGLGLKNSGYHPEMRAKSEEICRDYDNGERISVIAEKYNANPCLIRRILSENGRKITRKGHCVTGPEHGSARKDIWEKADQIFKENQVDKISMWDLHLKYGCGMNTIVRIIKTRKPAA